MPDRGLLAHIDLSVSDPARSIPFYSALLEALGYRRLASDSAEFVEPRPQRATWRIRYASGSTFEVEVRPARPESLQGPHDPDAPGLHHIPFHADSRQDVDRVHEVMRALAATILHAPADYTALRGYSPGYYAVFFADPDGVKLEVAHIPESNP
jgi:catechol 2,3-dioxygenase-like lactoylglutathione lyase family enzyme